MRWSRSWACFVRWIQHLSRVLAKASRLRGLSPVFHRQSTRLAATARAKVRFHGTLKPAPDACAPRTSASAPSSRLHFYLNGARLGRRRYFLTGMERYAQIKYMRYNLLIHRQSPTGRVDSADRGNSREFDVRRGFVRMGTTLLSITPPSKGAVEQRRCGMVATSVGRWESRSIKVNQTESK